MNNNNIINNINKNDSYINNSKINDNNKKDITESDSFNEEKNNSNNNHINLENNIENSEINRINNSDSIDKTINDNEIHSFNYTNIILIIFIYIFFGHFFILINICLQNLNKINFSFILNFLIIAYLEIPFFFYQFYVNLILLNIYLYINGFKSFISYFSDIIKMKFQKNNFHAIINNAYYISVILICGTFIQTKKLLYKQKGVIYMTILGIIVDLLILPLHIIINPFILCYIIKTKKYDDKSNENFYKKFYNYIFKN
jgi:hypothetical protein